MSYRYGHAYGTANASSSVGIIQNGGTIGNVMGTGGDMYITTTGPRLVPTELNSLTMRSFLNPPNTDITIGSSAAYIGAMNVGDGSWKFDSDGLTHKQKPIVICDNDTDDVSFNMVINNATVDIKDYIRSEITKATEPLTKRIKELEDLIEYMPSDPSNPSSFEGSHVKDAKDRFNQGVELQKKSK